MTAARAMRATLEEPTQWGGHDDPRPFVPRPRYLPVRDPDARRGEPKQRAKKAASA